MAPVSHPLHSPVAQDSSKKLLNLILLTKLPLILGVCPGGLSQGSVLDLSEALAFCDSAGMCPSFPPSSLYPEAPQSNGPCVSVSRDVTDGTSGLRYRALEGLGFAPQWDQGDLTYQESLTTHVVVVGFISPSLPLAWLTFP